jgi:hypothetical protein
MTRDEAINRVLAALGAGGTVLAHGPDPQATYARQLVDCAAALELIEFDEGAQTGSFRRPGVEDAAAPPIAQEENGDYVTRRERP